MDHGREPRCGTLAACRRQEASMTDYVRCQQSDGILTLTLNRPDKKNALTRAMYQVLGDAIDGAANDSQTRCILFEAEGDAFTAGNDLGDFAAINRAAQTAGHTEPHTNPLVTALARTTIPLV